MRMGWHEITENIRLWCISDERDYIYILMESGDITFLRPVNEANLTLPLDSEFTTNSEKTE